MCSCMVVGPNWSASTSPVTVLTVAMAAPPTLLCNVTVRQMITMRAAGVRELGGDIQLLDLPDPRTPGAGEVLIEVRAAGVGNWDEYVRTGGWDTGTRPPMALGVEASGVVVATGPGGGEVTVGVATGQTVLVHGAGGVTGGLLVQLAARAGAEVIATGSPAGAARIAAQ